MPMLGYAQFYVNVLDPFMFCHENVAYLDIRKHECKQNAIGSWNEDSTKLGYKGILVILQLIWSHVDHHFLTWCVCHVGPIPIFLKPSLSFFFSRFLSISLTLSSFTLKTQPPPIIVQASSNTKTQSKPFSRPYKCEPTVRLVKFGAQTRVLHYCFELRLFRRFSRRSSQGQISNSC